MAHLQAAAAQTGRTSGNGLSLAYREWNPDAPGEPLVLLHGITGSSSDWATTALHIPDRRMIALDARGHGGSDWDPSEEYAGDQHFADLAMALESLAIDRCMLAGFSMGGGVAMMAAACLPDRVSSVVVIDSYPHPQMTPGSRRIAGWVSRYAEMPGWFDPAIARSFAAQLAAGQENRLDLWPMWEALECPALVVRGAHSDVLPSPLAEEMVARQARAQLLTMPGVAHGIPYLRPRELASAIVDFAGQARS